MIILMITTKKISIEYTLKEMGRESKCVTKKKNQNAKQGNNGGNEGQKYNTENKDQKFSRKFFIS